VDLGAAEAASGTKRSHDDRKVDLVDPRAIETHERRIVRATGTPRLE
jgi:hypothetical protein